MTIDAVCRLVVRSCATENQFKIVELLDDGWHDGRRVIRIVTTDGTCCVLHAFPGDEV